MEDTDELKKHYATLLGLVHPWAISTVNLDIQGRKVDITVIYSDSLVPCPICKREGPPNDHAEMRTWRHLDTMQFKTLLHARIPRANCTEHGVKNIHIPWSEPYSRFTLLFTRFAIDVIRACNNISDAAWLLKMSWDEVHLIQEKAVDRGMRRRKNIKIKYLGIDEKNFKKGRKFVTVLNDLENQRVLDVEQGKSKEAADKLILSLSKRTRNSVEAVAADMAPVYTQSIEENLPGADIVYDRFHIARYLNEAVEKIWSSENRSLQKGNDDTLSGTKFVWLKNPENHTDNQKQAFENIKLQLYKVGRGWQIKEAFREFWNYTYKGSARKYFDRWYFWATHSRLKPIIRASKIIKKHLHYIMTYFDHCITNAGSEGMNSRIQGIKANARGFRNFENYRSSILFHLGGLELYP